MTAGQRRPIRMRAAGVSVFRHTGLVFGNNWNGYDVHKMSADQLDTLRTYLGRFITVHPSDADRLALLLDAEPDEPDEPDADADVDPDVESEPEPDADIEPDAGPGAEYADMTVQQLRALADDLGLDVPHRARKQDIIELLEDAAL